MSISSRPARPFLGLAVVFALAMGVSCSDVNTAPEEPETDDTEELALEVRPANATIEVDETIQFEAVMLVNGEHERALAAVSWQSGDESILTVSESGLATGVTAGVAQISAVGEDLRGNQRQANAGVTVEESVTPPPPPPPPDEGMPVVTNLTVNSSNAYAVVEEAFAATDTLDDIHVFQYTDRNYQIRFAPVALEGMTFIQTANDDKNLRPGSTDYMSFEIDRPATVLVAHQERVAQRPDWLVNGFAPTDSAIINEKDATSRYDIFGAVFEEGEVVLGSNIQFADGNWISMYTVIIGPPSLLTTLQGGG